MNVMNRGFLLGLLFVTALAWTVQTFASPVTCPKPIAAKHARLKTIMVTAHSEPIACAVCPVCDRLPPEIPLDLIPVQPLIYYSITTVVTPPEAPAGGFYVSDWVIGGLESGTAVVGDVLAGHGPSIRGGAAPEIDPTGALPAITLLAGALVVLCSGRK